MQVGEKLKTLLADVELEVLGIGTDRRGPWSVALGGDQGTPVQAVAAGVVTHVGGPETGVVVTGADGTAYVYGHVEAPNVHEQQTVTAGRTLGQIALDPGQQAHVAFSVVAPEGHLLDPEPHLTPPEEASVAEQVNGGADPGYAMPPEITDSVVNQLPAGPETSTVGPDSGPIHLEPAPPPGLLPSAEDMAAQLREAGWTVQPPALPAPIPGGGNPSL